MQRLIVHYLPIIRSYYEPAFRDLMMSPRNTLGVETALIRFFAGQIEGGWVYDLQLKFFQLLVRLHTWRPLPKVAPVALMRAFDRAATA